MNQATFLFIVVGLIGASVAEIDWCQVQAEYCEPDQEHINCLPNSYPDNTCANFEFIPITTELKNFILQKHNQYRQNIASGSNSKFPTASKMGLMKWDDSLQWMAEQHDSHCFWGHDQCRATPTYPYSGQNLLMSSSTAPNNVTKVLETGIDNWFNEWVNASVSFVDSVEESDLKVGHFTVMVKDINTRIGCSIINFTLMNAGVKRYRMHATCNYEENNVWGEGMYARGSPCSACASGCSTTYNALCNT